MLALGMVGVPPAVGFVGKWYIALGAVEGRAWPLAVVILASTLLTLAYFARILERIFFREATPTSTGEAETDAGVDVEGGSQNRPVVTDGVGDGTVAQSDRARTQVSTGMRATVLVAAVLAVLLGVAAFEYGQLLEPTIERLLE
jgi:multicomponent Na+:H+ antiporter subunit D